MVFKRGSYGSVSFSRSGLVLTAFLPENTSQGWCLRVGTNVYAGFDSRRAAVEAASRYV